MLLRTLILLLNLNMVTSISVEDPPYCTMRYKRLCQGKGSHVACQFPVPGPGQGCQNYSEIKFTSELRHFIVHYINRRRQRIASGKERVRGGVQLPQPEIMMLVSWDRELAHLAQRLADQCEFAHDDCRATVRYPYAGQSVGEVRWRVPNGGEVSVQRAIRRVFDAWWGEKRRVKPEQVSAPFQHTTKGTVWGHFTQLAVWTLRAVGCGAVRHGDHHPRLLLVCDFSHTNMLGQRTISPGPLVSCPTGSARRSRTAYPLLCVPVKKSKSSVYGQSDDEPNEKDDGHYDERETPWLVIHTKSHTYKSMKTTQVYDSDYALDKIFLHQNPVHLYEKYEESLKDRKQMNILKNEHETDTSTRRHYYAKIRNNVERFNDLPSTRPSTYEDDYLTMEHYKKTTTHEILLRNRWREPETRPHRPRAKALLPRPPEKPQRGSSKTFLMLDEDDLDQFFRDTGYNVNWRKQPLSG